MVRILFSRRLFSRPLPVGTRSRGQVSEITVKDAQCAARGGIFGYLIIGSIQPIFSHSSSSFSSGRNAAAVFWRGKRRWAAGVRAAGMSAHTGAAVGARTARGPSGDPTHPALGARRGWARWIGGGDPGRACDAHFGCGAVAPRVGRVDGRANRAASGRRSSRPVARTVPRPPRTSLPWARAIARLTAPRPSVDNGGRRWSSPQSPLGADDSYRENWW